MKLTQIIEGPENALAGSIAKDLGTNYLTMPNLVKPKAGDSTTEPIRKDGVPRKRRHRKFFKSQSEQPGT